MLLSFLYVLIVFFVKQLQTLRCHIAGSRDLGPSRCAGPGWISNDHDALHPLCTAFGSTDLGLALVFLLFVLSFFALDLYYSLSFPFDL